MKEVLQPISSCILPIENWNPGRADPTQEFHYVELSDVDQSSKVIRAPSRIRCADAPSRARQILRRGDVLVSTVRPNLNAVAMVGSHLDGATGSTGFCVLRPNPAKISGAYLFQWVKSPRFIGNMVSKATGASYPAVSDRIVRESLIPLYPLLEQERIAEILDRADELRKKRELAIAKLDQLVECAFVEMFGEVSESNRRFPLVPLSALCVRITDGTHQSPRWEESGIPFLFISNIVDGEIVFDTHKFISEETYKDLTRHCPIEMGDVLYTTVGSYGNVAVVNTPRKFAFQRHIAHIKPIRDRIVPTYLAAMLASTGVRRQVDVAARGVAQKTVNLSDLKALQVLEAPMEKQVEFAAVLAGIARVRGLFVDVRNKTTRLAASIAHEAFGD